MNQYMTALLLICATLLGQGQAAQLQQMSLLDVRARQELCQQGSVNTLIRAQLRILAKVDLLSLMNIAGQSAAPPVPNHSLTHSKQLVTSNYVHPPRPEFLLAQAQPRSP